MYIKRHMEAPVMALNQQYPVLLITGPRQVGKTTMLEHLIEIEGKGRTTISLDDLTERELAKTDPKMFFQIHQPPILIAPPKELRFYLSVQERLRKITLGAFPIHLDTKQLYRPHQYDAQLLI